MQSHHTGGIYLLELDTRSTIVAHSIAVLQSLSKMLKESTTPTTPLRLGKTHTLQSDYTENKNTTERTYSFVS